ncbi:MAG TPA: helix-turn-helix domain-containing protein [Ktedonobacteraceae bacterium]|nr:helix-turn-helix domain-containing protein [Ktedonobacteraceae bacterium]
MNGSIKDILERPRFECPVDGFQQMINGKYKLRILWALKLGPRRYGEIKKGLLRDISGSQEIAPRVLSRELKTLAAYGLIERTDYQVVPPKVEYALTPLGRSLLPLMAQIAEWGRQNLVRDAALAANEA